MFLGEGVDVGEESEEGDNGDKSGGLAWRDIRLIRSRRNWRKGIRRRIFLNKNRNYGCNL